MPNLFQSLFNLFRRKPTPSPLPKPLPDNADEPAQIMRSKVLLIVYDPVMEPLSGKTLSQYLNWYNTSDLVTGFVADILNVSGGTARYEIVQRVDENEFPAKVDGFCYSPQSYMDVLRGVTPPHQPQEVDYPAILLKHDILGRVAKGEIDEVWIFGYPHAGFYESTMGGPGAFWCNAPPLKNTDASKRRFVIMGFSYERQVGEMLEAYGHRTESILEKTFSRLTGDGNLWKRFIRYEKTTPGKAACGNIHFAPNSERDYDWNNPNPVTSESYDWLLNFPNFKGDFRTVSAPEWGSGDTRAHHIWWFNHIPKVAGRKNGIHHNWWHYVVDPNRVSA